jgi:hypothetical protein
MAEIETLGEHGFMGREEKETDGRGGGVTEKSRGYPRIKSNKKEIEFTGHF